MGKRLSMNRRQFIKTIGAGTCGAACHNLLVPNGFLAFAADPTGPVRYFIEVFLYGGCCGYGMFPQHNAGAQDKYGSLYRTPQQAVFVGHSDLSMHQAFTPLVTELFAGGSSRLAVIVDAAGLMANGQFSRNHDEAQKGNQVVTNDYVTATAIGVGAAIAQEIGHPYSLISFDGNSDFAAGGAVPGRSIGSLENAGRPDFWQGDFFNLTEANARNAAAPPLTEEQRYVSGAIVGMQDNMKTLRNLSQIQTPVAFPNTGIGNQFRDVTRLIMADLGRVFFTSQGGYDTHSNQAQSHQASFTELNNALLAFVQNLKQIPGVGAATAWDQTIVTTRRDFGRTFANGSNPTGTDHGLAATEFVLGGRVRGGVYGDPPDAAKYQNAREGYKGADWVQFNAGQLTKEIVQLGMGLTNIPFPDYVGNKYSPIGFLM